MKDLHFENLISKHYGTNTASRADVELQGLLVEIGIDYSISANVTDSAILGGIPGFCTESDRRAGMEANPCC
jgi:hypothetical protein